jgi:hypothetical protein
MVLDEAGRELVPMRGLVEHTRIHSQQVGRLFDGVVIVMKQVGDLCKVMPDSPAVVHVWASSRCGHSNTQSPGQGGTRRLWHDESIARPAPFISLIRVAGVVPLLRVSR